MSDTVIPFAREQRLRFIEALALWEGAVKRKRVSSAFGVAENHVTKDIRAYEALYPNNLIFNPRARAYIPKPGFRPAFISDEPQDYLALMYVYASANSKVALLELGGASVSAETLPTPPLSIEKSVFQCAIRALYQSSGLEVDYISMTHGKTVRRTLWPHSLVFTGFNWQVRAFDSQSNSFRDFLLQRMSMSEPILAQSPMPTNNDAEWNSWETLRITPHPKLSTLQQKLIANDFGMANDKDGYYWEVRLRVAMIGYFALRYNLDLDPMPANPKRFPLVLANWHDMKAYFFSSVTKRKE